MHDSHTASHPLYDELTHSSSIQPDDIDYSIPGDMVMIFEGEEPKVIVRSSKLKQDWVPRFGDDGIEWPVGAASTVEFRGAIYEISHASRHGTGYEYVLAPWPEHEIQRRVHVYSRASEELRQRQAILEEKYHRIARAIVVLYPLLGLLPRDVQRRLQNHWPVDFDSAVRASCWFQIAVSAAALFFGGFVRGYAVIAQSEVADSLTRPFGIGMSIWSILAPVLIADAVFRLRLLSFRNQARGNLLLEAIWRAAGR